MEVDPTTLARWEREEEELWGKYLVRIESFLASTKRLLPRSVA
jgi:hypothetical protein